MAVTFSNLRKRSVGDRKATIADVTVSTTGVNTFSPLAVGLHRVEAVVEGVNAGLSALREKPFEYLFLQNDPAPWRPTVRLGARHPWAPNTGCP